MPFTQKTLDFLFENKLRDSKVWFQEHRSEYQSLVLEPFREVVTALTPAMQKIDAKFITEPRVGRTISRIYRDTRFSKDKSTFRANMWFVFIREKKLYNGLPSFYFDLSPGGFEYGCGYYKAETAAMEVLRKLILSKDVDFLRALEAYEKQDIFEIDGECYKKSRFPEQPENLRNWLNRKNISFTRYVKAGSELFPVVFSEELPERLANDFKKLKPVYKFLCKLESLKDMK